MPDFELTEGTVRHRYRDLEPLSSDADNKAYARYVSTAPVTPLGHHKFTVGGSPVALPGLTPEVRRVYLTSIGQPLEFRDDGTDPDGSNGYPIPADTHFVYDNDVPSSFRLILASTATGPADVRVCYYG